MHFATLEKNAQKSYTKSKRPLKEENKANVYVSTEYGLVWAIQLEKRKSSR